MIFERSNKNVERLQNVLISDKQFSPQRLENVLRSDAYLLLQNYCNIKPSNLKVLVELQKDGLYNISICAVCDRLKIFGSLPNDYQ